MVVVVKWSCRVDVAGSRFRLAPPRLVRYVQVALDTFPDELVFACPLAKECDSSAAPLRVRVLVCVRERELLEIRGVFAIIQVRCGLTHHVLELHRLNAVCVSLQVFMSTYFTTLYFHLMSSVTALSSCELVLELFLCVGVSHRETIVLRLVLGLDLRFVRLILVAVLLRF